MRQKLAHTGKGINRRSFAYKLAHRLPATTGAHFGAPAAKIERASWPTKREETLGSLSRRHRQQQENKKKKKTKHWQRRRRHQQQPPTTFKKERDLLEVEGAKAAHGESRFRDPVDTPTVALRTSTKLLLVSLAKQATCRNCFGVLYQTQYRV